MRIGVLTALFGDLSFNQALDKAAAAGVTAVEIGAGGYPGTSHCPVSELLSSQSKCEAWLGEITSRGLILSALSVHNEPLHPNQAIAAEADKVIRDAIKLAQMLQVPIVNGFSGLPAGSPHDTMPNWITCPWPPHFLEMLDYQWNTVAIPYWQKIAQVAADHGVMFAVEMHPGQLVYNVETLLRMREACGESLGCNFDPSHLWWNGVDPVAAIRALGDAIVHVHGKDVYVDALNTMINGCNDQKSYSEIPRRSWTFRTIGYGHNIKAWKDIISTLRMIGYDYVISIEHEDILMSPDEGLIKAVAALKDINIFEPPGEMFWA